MTMHANVAEEIIDIAYESSVNILRSNYSNYMAEIIVSDCYEHNLLLKFNTIIILTWYHC